MNADHNLLELLIVSGMKVDTMRQRSLLSRTLFCSLLLRGDIRPTPPPPPPVAKPIDSKAAASQT